VLIGAAFLLENQADFACVVLSGPSVKVLDNISSFSIFMEKVFSALAPKVGPNERGVTSGCAKTLSIIF